MEEAFPKQMLRPVDWLSDSERFIAIRMARFSKTRRFGVIIQRISVRLSALLLERLSPDLADELISLLPASRREAIDALGPSARADEDRSSGYPTFLEQAAHAIGRDVPEEVLREIADSFLWGVSTELPADLKGRLHRALPTELKSRMDLYSDRQAESKVA